MEVEKVSPAVQTHDRNCHLEELHICTVEAKEIEVAFSTQVLYKVYRFGTRSWNGKGKEVSGRAGLFRSCLSVQLNSGKGKTLHNCVCLRSKKQQFLELSPLLILCSAQTVCTVK